MTALKFCLLLGMALLVKCQREDMKTKAELNKLFNSPVRTAEWVQRPKIGMPDSARSYFTTHSGLRVTTADGEKYLIHKGRNYGRASQTVVTPADHMSNRWRVKQTADFGGHSTIGQLTGAAGTKYGLLGRNCHDARRKMWNLGNRNKARAESNQRRSSSRKRFG